MSWLYFTILLKNKWCRSKNLIITILFLKRIKKWKITNYIKIKIIKSFNKIRQNI